MKNKYFIGLFVSLAVYVFLSWVLLLRDERAIGVIGNFYPAIGELLLNFRGNLLHLGLNIIPTILLGLVIIASFFLYWKLKTCQLSAKKVFGMVLVTQLLVLFSYPILSTDIFDYILSDRLAVVYHANVWNTAPSAYPADPFYNLASWQKQTNSYGPVNQLFYSLAGTVGGNDLVMNVISHKAIVLIFTLAAFFVFLKLSGPGNAILVFLNPLFILETAGSAHNDPLMLFFVLLGYLCYRKTAYVWAGLFLAAAVQVKFIPVILTAFIILQLVRQKKFVSTLTFTGVFLLFNLVAIIIMGQGSLTHLLNKGVTQAIYWQSLPMLVHKVFPTEKLFFTLGFILVLVWRVLRKAVEPLDSYVESVLIYLLVFTSFYWNWYVLWLLPFAVLVAWGKLSKTVLLLSLTSALAYPLYYLSLRFNYQHPVWPVIIYILIAGVPAGYYLYATIHKEK